MRTLFVYGLTVLCSCLLVADTSADEDEKGKPKAASDSGTQVQKSGDAKKRPLNTAEKARLAAKEAAAEEALRQKVAENIESIVDGRLTTKPTAWLRGKTHRFSLCEDARTGDWVVKERIGARMRACHRRGYISHKWE